MATKKSTPHESAATTSESAEVLSKSGAALEQQASSYGETRPTHVNGKYVGDKRLNEKTGEWEADPDAVAAEGGTRPEDIFDRIGNAFPHEAQRLVIEEIALRAGMTAESSQDLPDNYPTGGKSTASLRSDLTRSGGETSGPVPVPPGENGEAADTPAPASTDVNGAPARTGL